MTTWLTTVGIMLNIVGFGWQCWVICYYRTAQGISFPALFSAFTSSLITVLYSSVYGDASFLGNAWVCVLAQGFMLVPVFHWNRPTRTELMPCYGLSALVIATIFVPQKGAMLIAGSILGGLLLWHQPAKLILSGKKGVVQLFSLLCAELSSACWAAYCFEQIPATCSHFPYLGCKYAEAMWLYAGFCVFQIFTIWTYRKANGKH